MGEEQPSTNEHRRPPADPSQGVPPPGNSDHKVDPPPPTGKHRKEG